MEKLDKCEKVIVIGNPKEIPPKVDISLKSKGKFYLRIYNDLGEFFFLRSIDRVIIVNDLTNQTFRNRWYCSFTTEPVIASKSNLDYIKIYYSLPSKTICPSLPPIYYKVEKTILDKFGRNLRGYTIAFNLYLLLYEGKYLEFLKKFEYYMQWKI